MAQFSPSDPIVILSYARTPMGGMQGALADVSATDLGATAVKAAVERALHPAHRSAGVGEDDDRVRRGELGHGEICLERELRDAGASRSAGRARQWSRQAPPT